MSSKNTKNTCYHRLSGVEVLEHRCLLSATPLDVGAVYYEGTRTETGSGVDTAPDYLYVAFQGGAEGTEMTQIQVDLARYGQEGRYNFIDQGQGAYGSIQFEILAAEGYTVKDYEISHDGTLLTINLEGFTAGDVLKIQWDVDEVLNTDGDLDAESTGAEFAATSAVTATFENAYYEDAVMDNVPFKDRFEDYYAGYDIPGVPNDSYTNDYSDYATGEDQDVYTAGAFASLAQIPLPCTISGNVYEDYNADKSEYDASMDKQLGNVQIDLYRLNDAGTYELYDTTMTDENGHYSFDVEPGTYRVVEIQPEGYKDVTSFVGTINGEFVGTQIDVNELSDITLMGGQDSVENNFSEYRTCEVSGTVWVDHERNDAYDEGEILLEGVQIDLLDANGNVIATTYTNAEGYYEFIDLMPGTYGVFEHQPDYLNGGQQVGTEGGHIASQDQTEGIILLSGDSGKKYDFWEYEYATLSGYVFKDGEDLKLEEGSELPENVWELYPGIRDASDTPIPDVTLVLKDADGNEIARTTTDSNGYYEFRNVKPGEYMIYEVQPEGYIDGIDTPGSLGGDALEPDENQLYNINVNYGDDGVEYNFSEIRVQWTPKPETDQPGGTPSVSPFPSPIYHSGGGSAPVIGNGYTPSFGMSTGLSLGGGMGGGGASWHLALLGTGGGLGTGAMYAANSSASILSTADAQAKAMAQANAQAQANANAVAYTSLVGEIDLTAFDPNSWEGRALARIRAMLAEGVNPSDGLFTTNEFAGARLLAGDFNGDSIDELAIFIDGFWFIDFNGNRQWDDLDLWVKLGERGDQPVVGDWDGDGKMDIGVFGQPWERDRELIAHEFGLPDAENQLVGQYKHIPTVEAGHYYVKSQRDGVLRRDIVDHVFEFGREGDIAVAGDWNGDGVYSIGLFNNGRWTIDYDGDGRFTSADKQFTFGQKGDIPVVGKWDRSEVSKIGVYRNGEWFLDREGNGNFASAEHFHKGVAGDMPVVGDFDGTGVSDIATAETINEPIAVEAMPARR